jgi:dTDP-4-amino-4,6-dideoxygalactose transaminase
MLQPMNVVHQCNIASLQGGPAHAIGERSAEETTIDPAAEDVAESGLSIPLLSYFKLESINYIVYIIKNVLYHHMDALLSTS